MTLYLYDTRTRQLTETLEALSYDGRIITCDTGTLMPGGFTEFSSRPDLSESLRAAWRLHNPPESERIALLERLLADLLFGGDGI